MRKTGLSVFIILVILLVSCSSIAEPAVIYDNAYRLGRIPEDMYKSEPESDLHPPILHSDEFIEPVPLEWISSAGAEDSPFIPVGRDELYFMFIKDVREAPHIQVRDKVNGIWVSKFENGKWDSPKLVLLQGENELALNGAEFIRGNEMIFASAREGYEGIQWFRAEYANGNWVDWEVMEFNPGYEVGELHIHDNLIYFHSYMTGGKGDMDIWVSEISGNRLSKPVNLEGVNTEAQEGWPYISPDGSELWYTGIHKGVAAVYLAKKIDGRWGSGELVVSQFAGEPTLDKDGNLYFVHHYFIDGIMQEADIYIAKRKVSK